MRLTLAHFPHKSEPNEKFRARIDAVRCTESNREKNVNMKSGARLSAI
jgi:hypothetical protein